MQSSLTGFKTHGSDVWSIPGGSHSPGVTQATIKRKQLELIAAANSDLRDVRRRQAGAPNATGGLAPAVNPQPQTLNPTPYTLHPTPKTLNTKP